MRSKIVTQSFGVYPWTLRQNFRFMGVSFVGRLHHNSERNSGAESGVEILNRTITSCIDEYLTEY